MKKLFWTMISIIFVFGLHISLCSAGGVPPEIINAGREGISIFVKDPRMGGLHRLGFESQSDISDAALGDGFQVFTIPTDKLLSNDEPQEYQSLVVPTNQWEFLVVAGKNTNALLTIDLIDGKWAPVGIGASGLAKKLSKLLEAWPVSSGYQYKLISFYQVNAKFVEISQGDTVLGIVPLVSSIATIGEPKKEFDPIDIRDFSEVLKNLRSATLRTTQSGQ